jgi:hypothetical protein
MAWNWRTFLAVLIIGIAITCIGLAVNWVTNSSIANIQFQLQGTGLSTQERDNLQGALSWWQIQKTTFYGPISDFVVIVGIIIIVSSVIYGIVSIAGGFLEQSKQAEIKNAPINQEQAKAEESTQSVKKETREETKESTVDAKGETENNKAKLQNLALLFADGKISEESYLVAVRTIQQKIRELYETKQTPEKTTALYEEGKMNKKSPETSDQTPEKKPEQPDNFLNSPYFVLPSSRASTAEVPLPHNPNENTSWDNDKYPTKESYIYHEKPTSAWYLVPLLFGIMGGLVGYIGVKDEDKDMADGILAVGIIITVLEVIIGWAWLASLFSGGY